MDERDLAQVQAAFQTLLEVVGRECDAETAWVVECARVDVLAILSGEWSDVAMRERCGDDAPAEDGPRERALRALFASDFDSAVMELWPETFGPTDAAGVRDEIALDWSPWPPKNEMLLAALEVYAEKRSGALGRGASRAEAELFALMEARRVYRQLAG